MAVSVPSPTVTMTLSGASGVVNGVPLEGLEATDEPTAFVATTVML